MDLTIDLKTESSDATGHTGQLGTEGRGTATHHGSAADFEAHLDLAAKIALDVVKELDHVRRYVAPIGGFAHVLSKADAPLAFVFAAASWGASRASRFTSATP